MSCKHCQHRITYQELDASLDYDPEGKIFHVCMLTDAEVELDDNCDDYSRRPRQPWETIERWEALDNE